MFKPNTTVACIVRCQDKFLIVEEIDDGQRVFNQPAGHLEADETLIDAAKRELYEETGLSLEPQKLVGIYHSEIKEKNIQYLRFCYAIELGEQDFPETFPQDSDIIAARWMTWAEIEQKTSQMRSFMVQHCIKEYLAGKSYPLDAVQSYL
ncbi:NUDIX hydrolase [Gayadomonas joobiniege]|uniref:NUDIX hydrolase n=1 Tax=Gayadomonas joobiniege TaxID=1234606 RepID=UPI00037202FC|nr:NUDIX hydrolase [Gayadomonas joobiniege]